jgi:geranylgeranyl diphosphate synthase, type II
LTYDLNKALKLWRNAIEQELSKTDYPQAPDYLTSPMAYALEAKGKRLRPALFFATLEAFGQNWEDFVNIGTAIEVFHTSTLVHDDIMDGDEMRRGQETVHKKFDHNQALLVGDALIIYAYQLLETLQPEKFSEALKLFNKATMDVCVGQARDMQNERDNTISRLDYERMIDEKTSALLVLSCKMGALLSGARSKQIEAIGTFGLKLGRAFQMQDDFLELTSSAQDMGKSLGSDIDNEKMTWLWLDMIDHLTPLQKEERNDLNRSDAPVELIREKILGWMQSCGTFDRAKIQINNYFNDSIHYLKNANLENDQGLIALTEFILKRKN